MELGAPLDDVAVHVELPAAAVTGEQDEPSGTRRPGAEGPRVALRPHVDPVWFDQFALEVLVQAALIGAVGRAFDAEDRPGGRGSEVEVQVHTSSPSRARR